MCRGVAEFKYYWISVPVENYSLESVARKKIDQGRKVVRMLHPVMSCFEQKENFQAIFNITSIVTYGSKTWTELLDGTAQLFEMLKWYDVT